MPSDATLVHPPPSSPSYVVCSSMKCDSVRVSLCYGLVLLLVPSLHEEDRYQTLLEEDPRCEPLDCREPFEDFKRGFSLDHLLQVLARFTCLLQDMAEWELTSGLCHRRLPMRTCRDPLDSMPRSCSSLSRGRRASRLKCRCLYAICR